MIKRLLGHYWLKWAVGRLGGLLRHCDLKETNTQHFQQAKLYKEKWFAILQYCIRKYTLEQSSLFLDVQSPSHCLFLIPGAIIFLVSINNDSYDWFKVATHQFMDFCSNLIGWQSDKWIHNYRTQRRSLFLVPTTTLSGCPWFVCYVNMFATLEMKTQYMKTQSGRKWSNSLTWHHGGWINQLKESNIC